MSNVEEFISTWKKIIEDIKNSPTGIGQNEANIILRTFNLIELACNLDPQFRKDIRVSLLRDELIAALAIAVSRYRLHNRGLFAQIFGGILGSWKPKIKE